MQSSEDNFYCAVEFDGPQLDVRILITNKAWEAILASGKRVENVFSYLRSMIEQAASTKGIAQVRSECEAMFGPSSDFAFVAGPLRTEGKEIWQGELQTVAEFRAERDRLRGDDQSERRLGTLLPETVGLKNPCGPDLYISDLRKMAGNLLARQPGHEQEIRTLLNYAELGLGTTSGYVTVLPPATP